MNNRERLCDIGAEEALVFDNPDFDSAIIGATIDGKAVYDYDAMVAQLAEDDEIDVEDAIDFIEYNTIRSLPYAGELAPVIIRKFEGCWKC